MNKKPFFILVLAMFTDSAILADDQAPMSLGYAQQLSGKSVEEVKAADVNGDKHIDAAEFGALTGPRRAADRSRRD